MDYSTRTTRKIAGRAAEWEPEKVAVPMDGIYKRYPFGNILLWRTSEKLTVEKKLGQFH